jgi:hypothetical protein
VSQGNFERAWKKMEERGYQYGEDALEQVRLGWEMALREVSAGCAEPVVYDDEDATRAIGDVAERIYCATALHAATPEEMRKVAAVCVEAGRAFVETMYQMGIWTKGE